MGTDLSHPGVQHDGNTGGDQRCPPDTRRGSNLHLIVDGLQPEHDTRRTPATYDRILRHIDGRRITVHCTVVPQFLARVDYLQEFARIWSLQAGVRKIWFSIFTPQTGDCSPLGSQPRTAPTAIDRIAVPQGICTGSGPQRLPSSARLALGVRICANHKLRRG